MKKIFLILIVIGTLVISIAQADVIYVSGDVYGTWSADTVIVTAEVRIPPDSSLTIMPGVEVLFSVHCKLIVEGTISAVGTVNDSIRFDEYSPPGGHRWHGIRFLNATDVCSLKYCNLTNGWANGDGQDSNGGAIHCDNSSPIISGNTICANIANNNGGGIYCYNESSPIVSGNTIYENFATNYGGGIFCHDSNPIISGNTIIANLATHYGGGISCSGNSNPIISDNNIINENKAYIEGGGIYCTNYSSPIISGNTICGDSATYSGGGICCTDESNPIVSSNIINENRASVGGGIHCTGNSTPSIISNTIKENSVGLGSGGGISCDNNSIPTLISNIINGNSAATGGGIFCSSAPDTFELNEISRNTALGNGGGIYLGGVSITLNKCTIVDNIANSGGGLYCNASSPSLINCILWNNSPEQIAQGAGSNAVVTYSDIGQFWPGVGNINADPLFYSTTGDSAYYLTENSPCIDAGNPDPQYNDPDSTVADMGAYYFHHEPGLSGNLSGVLSAGEYHVVGDIFVQNGDSLIIEPGAVLRFDGNYQFDIYGYLYAVGTEQDSILFIPNHPDSNWGGLNFNTTSSNNSEYGYIVISGSNACGISTTSSFILNINHSTISDNNYPGAGSAMRFNQNCTLNMSNCEICNDTCIASIIYGNNCTFNISNCVFRNNLSTNQGAVICCAHPNNCIINNSLFFNNSSINGSSCIYSDYGHWTVNNCTFSGNSNPNNSGTICFNYTYNDTLTNNIFSSNTGAGIRLLGSGSIYPKNNDFYNNSNGNIIGNPPPAGFGNLSTTNANGDSCDQYMNIFLDPLFSTVPDSAFRLTENSPCIDAGDPASPLDPDSTIADMGAYYFHQEPGLSGALSGTIHAGVYDIVGNISVTDSLIIEPGVSFIFQGNYIFDISGAYLSAAGTEQDSIKFYPGSGVPNWGGIYFHYSSEGCIMEYCLITGAYNSSSGGGIHSDNCSPTFKHCTIYNNTAQGSGGGIYLERDSAVLSHCLIKGNTSLYSGPYGGGGIMLNECAALIDHCIITGNSCTNGTVGGIHNKGENSIITNTIIEGNNNGGLYFQQAGLYTVSFCDIYNNGGQNIFGVVPTFIGDIVTINANGDSCDMFRNILMNPLFVDPANGDYHLQANSPCIDAGDHNYPLDPNNSITEIGLFYFPQAPVPPPALFSGPLSGNLTAGDYYVTGDIYVDGSLTISPGANFIFTGYYGLEIGSSCVLTAVGAESDSIKFYPHPNAPYWKGITLHYAGNNSILEYCSISSAYKYGSGGGIHSDNCSPTFNHCAIINNTSEGSGGGIFLARQSAQINYCLIKGNTSLYSGPYGGGGIILSECAATIDQCTITGNSCPYGTVGGIHNKGDNSIITNTIVEGNNDGGLYFQQAGNYTVSYCDFHNNDGNNIFGYGIPTGLGIISTTNANGDSCDQYFNIFLDPLFSTIPDSAFRLTENSPCIDAGDPASPLDPDSTVADMGCYYFDQSGTQPNQLSGSLSGVLPAGEYHVVGDITVQNGDSLIIEPGAALLFDGFYEFEVYGYLYAVGNQADSIKFIRNNPDSAWAGIDFEDSSNDSSKLGFCLINGALAAGGWPYDRGGGIICIYSSPTIYNCTISNNYALIGGGIHGEMSASPYILNCIIEDNVADGSGGGITLGSGSASLISNCIVRNNTAGAHAGLHLGWSGLVTVLNCEIIDNSAGIGAGGVFGDQGSAIIESCLISGNTSGEFGAFYFWNGFNPLVKNCTIVNNNSNSGSIGIVNSNPSIVNTILGNNIGIGGIYFENSLNSSVSYCDMSNNSGGNFTGSPPANIGVIDTINANGDSCDQYFNIFLDPLFQAVTGDSAFRLTAASPCIDAGDPASPLDPDSTVADMGCYYFDQSGTQPNQLSGSLSGSLTAGEYHVVGDITVQNGDSLVIEPGAVLRFDGNCSFDINGYLEAAGVFSDSIVFTALDSVNGWSGIRFTSADTNSILEYCVVEYGKANGSFPYNDGGAIYCTNSSPIISRNTIRNNLAVSEGGGLYCDVNSHPAIANNSIIGNTATDGGGVFIATDCNPIVSNNTIAFNNATNGGAGIFIHYSNARLFENNISDNSAGSQGGGIFLLESSSILENCKFYRDSASLYGGGIYCVSSNASIIDCDISNNSSLGYGGGIWCSQSRATIEYCIITENLANNYGGGLYLGYDSSNVNNCTIVGNNSSTQGGAIIITDGSEPDIRNCIISDNLASDYGGIYFHNPGANDSVSYCDFNNNNPYNYGGNLPQNLGSITTVNTNGDSCDIYSNIFLDPLFSTVPDSAFRLTANSPCIDAGDPASPLDPDSTVADMGAYYFHQDSVITPPDTLWTRTYGGSDGEEGMDVQQTSDGGYIFVGIGRSFGHGGPDAYLIKTDANGDTLWTRSYGGIEQDWGVSVCQTIDGGYVITGETNSFGAVEFDVFLIKTDANGDTIWTRTFGGTNADIGKCVQQTTDGGYIITGYTRSFGAGDWDVWLIKTDTNGDTIWTRTFGGTSEDNGYFVQQTTDGGYIVTGSTQSFGAGIHDVYLIKTDMNGDSVWTKTFGGSDIDFARCVQQTTDGGYIILGSTNSFSGNIWPDLWLIKTNSNGDTLWTRTHGGGDSESGCRVQQCFDEGYIISGYTHSYGGTRDAYVLKTNINGYFSWMRVFGGAGYECGTCVDQTLDGGYIVGGYTTTFGAGSYDAYLIRLAWDSIGPPPPPLPTLSLTYPNGGESWIIGSSQTISWTADPGFERFDLLLSRDNGGSYEILQTAIPGTETSWIWNGVTPDISDSCIVRIAGHYDGRLSFDESDGMFSIVQGGPDTLWTRTYGGSGYDTGGSVRQTSDGGFIIAGITGSIGPGSWNVYGIKTDANGDTVWTKPYGGPAWDEGTDASPTSDGGYIFSGWTESFGAGSRDAYLVKTDANGDTVWTRTFGGSSMDVVNWVEQTSDGGYITVGLTTSFGVPVRAVYLIKTDASGNETWHRTYGGNGYDLANCVQQTSDGGYIITGFTQSFGAGENDVYLIKTDSSGIETWERTFGGASGDGGYVVRETTDGGYIISAYTESFGAGGSDIYLIKTDASGNELWSQTFGGDSTEYGLNVWQTSEGDYVVVGNTNSFGAGSYDAYLLEVDASGNGIWSKTIGGIESDACSGLQQTSDNGYIIAGTTYSYGAGDCDVYLIRLEGDSVPPAPTVALTYPNGGESWTIGDSVDITWTLDPGFDSLEVLLTRNDGGSWAALASALAGTDTNYAWNGVTAPPSDSCRVKVLGHYGGSQAEDVSDSLFSIIPAAPPPMITVTYPNGGESWETGETPTITWSHDPLFIGFDVLLSRNAGTDWETLDDSLSGFFVSWPWTTGVTPPESDSCLVKIMGYYYTGLTFEDNSDSLFSITEPPAHPGPDTAWTRTFGSVGDDEARSLFRTPADGGYALTGYASPFGSKDVLLIKTNSAGLQEMLRTYGGNFDDIGYSIQQTVDGGYIIAGSKVPSAGAPTDIYIIKTLANGTAQWDTTIGLLNSEECAYSVQQTSDGGFIFTGLFTDNIYSTQVILYKTDANGNQQWLHTFGGLGVDAGRCVRQTTDGGYIITGYTTSSGAGQEDVYLIKTNPSGQLQGDWTYGGAGIDKGYSVRQTSDGGYIITGYTTSFGVGQEDVYLVKTNSSGGFMWSRDFGGPGSDIGYSVRQTSDGGYIVAGTTTSYGAGASDAYLIKTDSLGTPEWSQTWGGDGTEAAYSVQIVPGAGYAFAGFTDSYGSGGKDVWLVKLGADSFEVIITLEPHIPPIVIPANGGSFTFDITAENTTPVTQTIDFWSQVILPTMGAVPIINIYGFNMPPATGTRTLTQQVPQIAPGGIYTYRAYVGTYPWVVGHSDWFNFEKLGGEAGSGLGSPSDWPCSGEFFDGIELLNSKAVPKTYALHTPYPNPFNPIAHITFALPEAVRVKLKVYDVTGREVAALVDNYLEAGYHDIVFDGSNLSSGIYFYKINAGGFSETRKMILVK